MRIVDIVEGTSVDGPGFRTSIYFAGCNHQCPGCHNPSTWPVDAGRDYSIEEVLEIIGRNRFNVTFSGGDPMLQAAQLLPLAKAIRALGYTIWCYTGFTYHQVLANDTMRQLLPYLEVLVDGPFVQSQRSIEILFRGSTNQRLIDLRTSTPDHITLWHPDF